MSDPTSPLRIDIVSDVVCPWCVVGYRQLAQALEQAETAHEIHWHPFELNPEMPAQGQNLRDHIMEKYGSTAEQSQDARDRLAAVGKDVGFEFRFTDDMRMYNTFNVHQLLRWAGAQGQEHALKQAFFTAYFTDHADLSDRAALIKVVTSIGLNAQEAAEVLEDQRFAPEVRKLQNFWINQGVRGVPAVVFDQKHLVSGAQGVENYSQILAQLAEMQA
ncbi:MAG: DsbA family oxidoreductase [Thalassovita sp.]